MREPTTIDQLALGRHRLDRDLAVLGGVADVVAGRVLQFGETFAQPLHGLHGLVDRQRGLRQPDHLVLVADGDVVDRARAVDELHVVGRLAGGADDLFVAFVTDQQDVVVVAGEPLGLVVHLGDQRAGRVDHLQAALGGRLVHRRRDPVRGEHHDGAFGHLVGLVDEHGTGLGQRLDDVHVVDDLVAHVDGSAVLLERTFDGFDGAVDSGAVSAGLGEQHPLSP